MTIFNTQRSSLKKDKLHTRLVKSGKADDDMSIKSIDSQIMIARTSDFARDNSAVQKKPEISQDYLAAQEKINEAQEQSRVAGTPESEQADIRPDEDGGGSGAYDDGAPESDRDSDSSDAEANFLVPPGNNVIDIRV